MSIENPFVAFNHKGVQTERFLSNQIAFLRKSNKRLQDVISTLGNKRWNRLEHGKTSSGRTETPEIGREGACL